MEEEGDTTLHAHTWDLHTLHGNRHGPQRATSGSEQVMAAGNVTAQEGSSGGLQSGTEHNRHAMEEEGDTTLHAHTSTRCTVTVMGHRELLPARKR